MFAHLADLHLDAHAAQIKKKDPVTNRPMRELDMEHAFELAVDDIISNAEDVDCCVIAGDIFDSYHATADSAIVAINQIRRITEAGIHVVAIAGNHDTPTNVRKTPKFLELAAALGDNDLVTMSYDDVKHVVIGDTEYVLLPHLVCLGGLFTEADLTPTSDAKHAVLVVHGVAAGDPSLKQQDEMREIPIAKWIMDMPWDYVAFGHYHMPGWVPGYVGKAAYSGSLENTVISGPDVCMHRGPVYVDLDADGDMMMTMHEMPVRSIIELEPLDLSGKDLEPAEIDEEIDRHIAQGNTDGAIVRLRVKGITRSAYKSLPRRNFMQSNPEAMHIKIDWEFATDGMAEDASVLLEDEDGNPVLDEAGNEVVSEEGIRERGFLPLAKEAELALLRLIEAGQISPSKQADITAVLQQYLQ